MKRLALCCLVAYLAAQTFQHYVFAVLSAAGDDAAAWRATLQPLNRARALVLLLAFLPLTVAFITLCAHKLRTAPRRALVACVFLLAFCFYEISYRSIEYFVVDAIWTRELLDTTDPLIRATLQERLDLFGEIVRGVYFPLLLTQLVGSLFLFATTFPPSRADLFLRIAMVVNALRLAGRLSATYGGVAWLSPFNARLYFPCILIVYVALIIHVARSDDGLAHAAPGSSLRSG